LEVAVISPQDKGWGKLDMVQLSPLRNLSGKAEMTQDVE
jgi:hypothetical protein